MKTVPKTVFGTKTEKQIQKVSLYSDTSLFLFYFQALEKDRKASLAVKILWNPTPLAIPELCPIPAKDLPMVRTVPVQFIYLFYLILARYPGSSRQRDQPDIFAASVQDTKRDSCQV